MNFHFANTIEQDGKKFGAVKEGNIDESGKITYTKNESLAMNMKEFLFSFLIHLKNKSQLNS